MPTSIFTPGSVVPQGADDCVVYSNSPDLDGFGTDETPPGWPALSCKITAVEVELTVTSQFTANGQVQVVVTPPNALAPLPGAVSDASGTWSGWDGGTGQYRSSTADAYYLDKFGGWVTDYITWGSGGATGTWLTSTSTATPGTGIDIRVRCRRANWTSNADASQVTHICTTGTALGRFNGHVSMYSGAVNFIMLNIPGTSVTGVTAPAAAFSYTNGQWHNFRITYDGVTARFYEDATADEGLGSWTLVHSAAMTAQQTMPTTDWRIGATNANNSGFNGDISHLVALDGAGQSIHDLALGGMDAALDSGWSGTSNTISRSPTFNTAVGATVPATKRVRVDLDTPCPLADFRLIVDAQTGALTVDEILLEAECEPPVTRRRRRGLGLIRG